MENINMKEPKDKRTNEYKLWKASQETKSEGLGDTIEKITEATGIKAVVKSLFGDDCGCDERKKKLNEIWRYKKIECLTEKEFVYIKNWLSLQKNDVTPIEQMELLAIYNRVFTENRQMSTCGSCVKEVVNQLETLINNY